jgi:hypothetical protein
MLVGDDQARAVLQEPVGQCERGREAGDGVRDLGLRNHLSAASCRTVKRRLPAYAKEAFRQELSAACAAHAELGRASLVLYDASTLYFETDAGDGFRESGFRRSGGWSRRSPSGCSPIRTGSR